MTHVTTLAGPERRGRWSDEQREHILAEASQSGARVCDVARRDDVARGLIYEWPRAWKVFQTVREKVACRDFGRSPHRRHRSMSCCRFDGHEVKVHALVA